MGRFLFLLFSFLGWTAAFGQSVQERYIEKYKDIAIEEMHRTGIPASIKMAQAILESNSGRSYLAKEGLNHFGIKCGSSWSGRSVMRKDDDYKNGRLVQSCFRAYADAEESFVAHSEFLRDPRKNHRYGFLFRLEPTNYKSWAYGLKKAGYATNPKYPKLLIDLIERYQLDQLDAMEEPDPAQLVQEENYSPTLQRVNDVEFVYARLGERPIEISMDFGVSPEKIVKYNERIASPNQHLEAGERVFLQKKRRSYRGEKKYHYVKAGEDMFSIAQKYGIRLNKLLNKNKMSAGEEPAVGEQIRLRGLSWFESKPVLRSEKESILPEDAKEDLPADEEIQALPNTEESENENAADISKQADSAENADVEHTAKSANLPKSDGPAEAAEKDSAKKEEIATSAGDEVERSVSASTPDLAENAVDSAASNRDTSMVEQYIVQKGDTLYSISRRFGLSVEELKQKNDLLDNGIQIGQALQLR
jgi:flagellum-specific peptidoglycan hydrolase FlgJ